MLRNYLNIINYISILLLAGLFLYGTLTLFVLSYLLVHAIVLVRAFLVRSPIAAKLALIAAYTVVIVIQLTFVSQVMFSKDFSLVEFYIAKIFSILLLLLPVMISRFITISKYSRFYLPSLQELATISFAKINSVATDISNGADGINRVSKSLTQENFREITSDLPRHDSFRYINNESLTNEYFELANESVLDLHVYIVISNTGSAASEVISVFTQKQYNHASLSFDRNLKTIISYNGGERVYPPGLNQEMVEYFAKKKGASILVYKLPCTKEQKRVIIEKVREINKDGSAYNMMGLVTKYSHKPNIMFCSQFVYKMLELVGLAFFEKHDGAVKPTDFVELDYYRKMQFDYEMRLR